MRNCKVLIYIMLLWSVESAFAEDFFAPTLVSIEPATYGYGKAKTVGLSTTAYTRATQQATQTAGRRRNALGINATKRVTATSAGSPGVVFAGSSNYQSFSSTRTSKVDYTADVSAPFSSLNLGITTASAGPFKAPPGPPIGQLAPLSGDVWAFSALLLAYLSFVVARRRKHRAKEIQDELGIRSEEFLNKE